MSLIRNYLVCYRYLYASLAMQLVRTVSSFVVSVIKVLHITLYLLRSPVLPPLLIEIASLRLARELGNVLISNTSFYNY